VEFAGYYNHSAEEVRNMLNKYGIECASVHQAPSLFLEKGQEAVDYLKTIGVKYCAIPWYGVSKLKGTEAGAEYVVVEQDCSTDIAPMKAAKMSREYLKTLGL